MADTVIHVPTISIVMSVYNGERFVREAVQSILDQTYTDFEFIIIDDYSTDRSAEILRSYSDPRIRIVTHDKNLGLPRSLNDGIALARGKFVARMDQDDISEPKRLSRQIEFLQKHPDIGIVGTQAFLVDEAGVRIGRARRPQDPVLIKWKALVSNPMVHPTVLGYAELFKQNPYNTTYQQSEDFELWSRLLFQNGTRFANLPEFLLRYRLHDASMTKSLRVGKDLSIETTVRNIRRYIPVGVWEESTLRNIRRKLPVPFRDMLRIFFLYRNSAKNFCIRERVSFSTHRMYIRSSPYRILFDLIRSTLLL